MSGFAELCIECRNSTSGCCLRHTTVVLPTLQMPNAAVAAGTLAHGSRDATSVLDDIIAQAEVWERSVAELVRRGQRQAIGESYVVILTSAGAAALRALRDTVEERDWLRWRLAALQGERGFTLADYRAHITRAASATEGK